MKRILLGLFSAAIMFGATGYKVQTKYPVPGTGGWDYVTLDSAGEAALHLACDAGGGRRRR